MNKLKRQRWEQQNQKKPQRASGYTKNKSSFHIFFIDPFLFYELRPKPTSSSSSLQNLNTHPKKANFLFVYTFGSQLTTKTQAFFSLLFEQIAHPLKFTFHGHL